ncbi:LytTR family transcriptional regulator [Lactobacillus sp. DCY120]|uniref:LytTR family transcriptional regulator n=1 Tax=Bombilactobacillus apium TaxID=2675299 RepID=A0A850R7B8_9LACO|nr:LytTR family DNA-binding domain-containing protein [Bombilactobacillus apium]NVY96737.1 LytTR family transcriptional regulator [Bombilactobacillus apium]
MRVEVEIDSQLSEDWAGFHIQTLTTELQQLITSIENNSQYIWGYREQEIRPINLNELYQVYTEDDHVWLQLAEFKGRFYQVAVQLNQNFIVAGRDLAFNFQLMDHLEVNNNGTIDMLLKNQQRVPISRGKVQEIKERLDL